VVVGCDNESRRGIPMETYLNNAVHWVRYANTVKGYGVKYWEIGNENWNDKGILPDAFGKIVSRFSRAMKAEDPSIFIGASGHNETWWKPFLITAAGDIDFLTVSEYACWRYMGYDTYANADQADLIKTAREALLSIKRYAHKAADRLFVVVTEFNARDYALEFEGAGWSSENNLGHALVNIDLCGQIAREQKIAYGLLWNTRWMDQSQQHNDIFYGLDANNGLMPSAMCLYIWCRFMREEILTVTCPPVLAGYASRDEKGMTLFIINKGYAETNVTLSAEGAVYPCRRYIFAGNGSLDLYPVFRELPPCDHEQVVLPPVSLTILDWNRSRL